MSSSETTGIFATTIKPVALEMARIAPDAIVFGSGFFALITMSLPYAIFFLSMVEASFIYKMIAWATSFLNLYYFPTPGSEKFSRSCRVGFTGWNIDSLSLFKTSGLYMFPSAAIFMISVASAYVFNTLQYQAKELQALGPAYSSKYYLSMIALTLLIILISLFRLWSQCDTPAIVIFSVLFGFIIGSFLVFQNYNLFGESGAHAINLLGIPILRNRTATGQRLYICPTKSS
jgi:hypothetical protein